MEDKKIKHHRGRRKKKGNLLSNIILVIAVGTFLYSGYQLYTIMADYQEGEEEYEEIKEMVITEAYTEEEDVTAEEAEQEFRVDFEKLLALNDDVVGWIKFDEPAQISYPIAHGTSNNQYLRRTLEGKRNTAGTIFVDYMNEGDFSDENTFVYGHNMRNNTMFGQLKKYRDKEFYEQYPYFYIYTPDGRQTTYEIFAIRVVEDTSDAFQIGYGDEEGFQKYLDIARKQSLYQTDVEVSGNSRIVTLSTCVRGQSDKRLLIHAVAVSESLPEE